MKFQCRIYVFVLLLMVGLVPVRGAEEMAPERVWNRENLLRFYTEEEGVVYTDWADAGTSHMYWREMTEKGMVTVRNAGRLENGRAVYRKGFRSLKLGGVAMPKINWYCYTGKSQSSFDSISDDLFQKGYVLISVQSFQDEQGIQRFQALWVMPDENGAGRKRVKANPNVLPEDSGKNPLMGILEPE